MLTQSSESGSRSAAFSQTVGASLDLRVREAEHLEAFDGLYPVDQLSGGEEAMILWGDVSLLARHPSRIAF